jgi:hypothetical protein
MDDFEYNDDELVEAVVTMANDEYILRAEKSIYDGRQTFCKLSTRHRPKQVLG